MTFFKRRNSRYLVCGVGSLQPIRSITSLENSAIQGNEDERFLADSDAGSFEYAHILTFDRTIKKINK